MGIPRGFCFRPKNFTAKTAKIAKGGQL